MILTLTSEKKIEIKALITPCLNNNVTSLKELARIIGNIIASFPALTYEPRHCRHLGRDKILGLKRHRSNFGRTIVLSAIAVCHIQWWIDNIENSCHHILKANFDFTIYADTCLPGWGIPDGVLPSKGL